MSDNTFNRRRLLTSAVLGGATVLGATALGALSPEIAFASTAPTVAPALGGADPNFAEGRITAINNNQLLVTGSDGVLHRIQVTGGTSIWKLRSTTFDQVALGDGLYARGVRMPDGTLAAEALWVNIVNIHGDIMVMDSSSITLNHNGNKIVGRVVAGTSAAVYNGTPAVSDLSMLQVGRHVQMLGAWIPDTNEVHIATVFATV